MGMLAIRESSWHYRLYQFLHRIWFFNEPTKDVESLCTYSQFLFWFGCLSVIACPFMLIGWLVVKGERKLYEWIADSRFGDWLAKSEAKKINAYDDKSWGHHIEEYSQKMYRQPALYATGASMVLFISVFILGFALLVAGMGIYAFCSVLTEIPSAIWSAIIAIGWAVFVLCSWIGVLICLLGTGLWWAGWGIKVSAIWLGVHLAIIGMWIGIVVGAFIVGSVLILLLIKFFNTGIGKKLVEYLAFKINGFERVREKQKDRREAFRRKMREEGVETKTSEEVIEAWFLGFFTGIGSIFKFLWGIIKAIGNWFANAFWRGKKTIKKVGDTEIEVSVLGLFPLIAQTIAGIYKGICPLVQVIREGDEAETVEVKSE